MEDIIKKFTENLVERLHLDKLPSDMRQRYIEKMSAQAQQRVGLMVMGKLSEDDLDAYESMVVSDKPQPNELLAFLQEKIPNFEKEVEKTLQIFAEEAAEDFISIQATIANKS
ncbi:MAG: DUF5663 domain-containing protein [Candidatus Komeilibacteria bacterium]